MDSDIPSDAPRPRLCHLRKRPDFAGYGFNLHAEKGKNGQFIGKVDAGSPADLAGLRDGDRIVEVNGVNVSNENHQQVVQRVKAVADETKFLVVDGVADEYYRERKIVVRGDLPNVHLLETPVFHAAGTNGTDSSDLEHRPRLCVLKIWPEFTGFGFNLHAEKGKSVQYIGKVDANSPGEAAGLKEHDRIVEVNGHNVSAESHQEVVKRIKSDPTQVTMLVVDQEADAYFKREGIAPSSHMSSVVRIVCPDSKPGHYHSQEFENGKSDHNGDDESTHSQKDSDDRGDDDDDDDDDDDHREIDDVADEIANIARDAERGEVFGKADEKKPDKAGLSLNVTATSTSIGSTSSSTPTPLESPKTPVVIDGIEFAGTAEEARKKMSKKRNVKDTSMSVKAKYDLFQKL